MTFSEMASMTGGGVQTPGFMGHGKQFISSKKFIAAEGGPGRIVWMPKELKDQVRERLDATAKEMYGVDNFTDMIADETVCTEGADRVPGRAKTGGNRTDEPPVGSIVSGAGSGGTAGDIVLGMQR